MSNNKEQILRNVEYLSGGMTTFKTLCGNREKSCNAPYYDLMEEWVDTIYDTIELVEEDYKECQKLLKSSPQ